MTNKLFYGDIPPRDGERDRLAKPSGGGGPRLLQTPIKQVKRARKLRRQMSLPEVLRWQVLRKRPNGLKFRRQFPFGTITADFACLERRLIIEVDGEGHSFGDQPRRDAARDALFRREGFKAMRIAARDVLEDMDAVLRWIVATCSEIKSSPERAKPVEGAHVSAPRTAGNVVPRPTVGPLHRGAARRGSPPRSGEHREDL